MTLVGARVPKCSLACAAGWPLPTSHVAVLYVGVQPMSRRGCGLWSVRVVYVGYL